MVDQHQRLNDLMKVRRLDLGLKNWRDLSNLAGISYETLRALRTGSNPSEHTERALEDALQWRHGSIRAVLEGGTPSPVVDDRGSPMDQAEADAAYSERQARAMVDDIRRLNRRDRTAVEALIRSLRDTADSSTGKGPTGH